MIRLISLVIFTFILATNVNGQNIIYDGNDVLINQSGWDLTRFENGKVVKDPIRKNALCNILPELYIDSFPRNVIEEKCLSDHQINNLKEEFILPNEEIKLESPFNGYD